MKPVPLRTLLGGEVIPPAWSQWFQQVVVSLAGWSNAIALTQQIDFPSIPANSEANSNVTVTGARPGATVMVAPLTNTSGIIFTAAVTANDTVTVYAKNFTTGAVNPVPTSFRITVLQN